MHIQIWGSRGTLPRGGRPSAFGGNTPCVTCTARDGTILVMDAGTGIYNFGRSLQQSTGPTEMHMLYSHVHWDHIQGFPLFMPAYHPRTGIHIHGGPPSGGTWENALHGQMRDPYFPVPFTALKGSISFHEWPAKGSMEIGSFRVLRAPTRHPGGGYAYRILCDGLTMVYATDTEHPEEGVDSNLNTLAHGADILLYDATFFPEEYADHRGWGHSTWQHGIELARSAGVQRLILFHHDPSHDDVSLADMENRAQEIFPAVTAAREGPVLPI